MGESDINGIRKRDTKHELRERDTTIHTYHEPFQGMMGRDTKIGLRERDTQIHTYHEPFQGTRQRDPNGMRERDTKH